MASEWREELREIVESEEKMMQYHGGKMKRIEGWQRKKRERERERGG